MNSSPSPDRALSNAAVTRAVSISMWFSTLPVRAAYRSVRQLDADCFRTHLDAVANICRAVALLKLVTDVTHEELGLRIVGHLGVKVREQRSCTREYLDVCVNDGRVSCDFALGGPGRGHEAELALQDQPAYIARLIVPVEQPLANSATVLACATRTGVLEELNHIVNEARDGREDWTERLFRNEWGGRGGAGNDS